MSKWKFDEISQMEGRKGNVFFNDALNTFYLQLYSIRHIAKDHSDSEKENPFLSHGLLSNYQQGFFYMHHADRTVHTTAFVTRTVVEHWLQQELTGSTRRD